MKTNQVTKQSLEQSPVVDFDQLVADAQVEQAASKSVEGATSFDLIAKYGTKSNAIRALTNLGWKRGQIAKALNIKYQFVRNVQVTPVGKRPDLL